MLVGRDHAQRDVEALLAGARLGHSGVLVVRGEAGIGKSALLEDAVTRAAGLRVLRASGAEAERELPFAALAAVLRPLVDRIDALPGPQAEALGVALALRQGAAPDRFAISAGLLTLLTRMSEEQPIAVVVDDGHLLDRPSAQALAFVARRLVADAVLLLVAVRPGETDVWDGLPSLDLRRLAPDVARELARVTGEQLSEEQLDRIVHVADGNPLVLRTLAEQPESLGGMPELPLEGALASVAAAAFGVRLGRLDPDGLAALRVAAVAGEDLALVGRACAAAEVRVDHLGAAEEAGLVTLTPERVVFVHPLARAAAYAGAPAGTRRRLHALVAEASAPGDVDRRAWHRAAAALGPDESVAAELDGVAARAAARGAHAVAASASERAARLSPAPADTGRRLLSAGEAAWLAGDDAMAAVVLEEALRHVTTPTLRARVRAVTGLAAARSGRLGLARAELLEAAERAEPEAVGEALLLYSEAIEACYYLLDVPAACAVADRVETLLADPAVRASAGPRAEAIASIALGVARTLAGGAGAEQLRHGVTLLADLPIDEPRARSAWELVAPLYLRETDAGRDLVRRAISERREAGAIGDLPHLLFHLARFDATGREHWTRAEGGYGEAIALARESGQATELAVSLSGLCWLHGRQGRVEDCRAVAAEARTVADAHDVLVAVAWVDYALAELELSLGAVAESIAGFTALAEVLAGRAMADPDLSPVPELVEARLRRGDLVVDLAADPLVTDYLARADAKARPWSLARAARVQALLCRDEEVDASYELALARHAMTPDRFETARTRLLYGERLRRLRRRVDCRVHLRAALEDFEALGARRWSELALAELDATGLTVQRRETGPVVALTSRELQIALLLADGQTTREAAASLFISPKTVEYHLRHIYTKLDIGSRAELAERMGGSG